MGDGHLTTILAMESDEFIKSCVENLVLNPSESEDLSDSECDVPACDDFTTFSNLLFDADDDFFSSDNESFFDEDISKEIYSNPLYDEGIISIKIDPHHFNAESGLIESLLSQDSSIISSSLKIDSLLDEFAGELILLKSIPSGIDETDCDPKEEIRLIEKLLYDNSSPRPPEEFISKNSDAAIESFSPSPIHQLLSNDSLLLSKNKSFHFDIPSSPRPPAKPPDDDEIKPNSRILTVKVGTFSSWIFHTLLDQLKYGENQVKLSDPKQALRGRHPMSDNGTEFKNSVMTRFCDDKEAVNTTCYVLNRALVTKPHNKTPYELIRGSLITRHHVTILNTRDNLGKFEGKDNEGYFVRYSMVSKAMRVFNKRTSIVEETLNIRFQENVPNVKGNGPYWLFDIDLLTISMNYVPVVTGNQTNGIVGTKEKLFADGKDSTEDARKKAPAVDASEASNNVSTAGPSFVNAASQIPLNAAGPSITSTPMESNKPLIKDEEAEDVDVHLYRSMIGLLMYLTASRPDITFVVYACTRFQVTPNILHLHAMKRIFRYPKASRPNITFAVYACTRFQVTPNILHLHAMKRIFRYPKGQPKLGLWYPKDSPLYLEAYSDSDYARASLERKSTTRGCQFLGKRLIS
nr:hypothetical protein [Tanacetum cinerariifolium]